jgi:hypothetical protein
MPLLHLDSVLVRAPLHVAPVTIGHAGTSLAWPDHPPVGASSLLWCVCSRWCPQQNPAVLAYDPTGLRSAMSATHGEANATTIPTTTITFHEQPPDNSFLHWPSL